MLSYLVDYGEVISRPLGREAVAEMAHIAGLDGEDFENRYWRFRGEYDRGQPAGDYWRAVLGSTPAAKTTEELIRVDIAGWMHFDPGTVRWIEQRRAEGVPLWLLSNAPTELAAAIESSRLKNLFDGLLFSSALRVTKPDTRCFAHAHAAIGGVTHDITFIDDRAENIAAASQYGLTTHLFTGPAQLPGHAPHRP